MKKATSKNVPRPEQERDSLTIRLKMKAAMNAIADVQELCDIMDEQQISTINMRFVENAEDKAATFLRTYAEELRHKIGLHSLERRRAENNRMIRDTADELAKDAAARETATKTASGPASRTRKTS